MKPSLRLSSVALLLMAGASVLSAKPVTMDRAKAAAKGWVGSKKMVKNVMAIHGKGVDGMFAPRKVSAPLFYVAQFQSGGFVATAADDELTPIIACSEDGAFSADPENPLYGILLADLEGRMKALQAKANLSRGAEGRQAGSNQELWDKLVEIGSSNQPFATTRGITLIDDIRVDAMVLSKWNQSTSNDWVNVYNLFTPDHKSAGCTATALAQMVRYYEWPLDGIGAKTYRISIVTQEGTEYLDLPTRGGDGQGGPYNWQQMVLDPSKKNTQAERDMVGSLTYDAALALNTEWSKSGGGANFPVSATALKRTFLFENAECLTPTSGTGTLTNRGDFLTIVNSNLDARLPVMLGIFRKKPDGTTGGHSVVCDGYGYHQGIPYHHVNLGWGGSQTAWYNFPIIDAGNYFYDYFSGLVYNVYPKGSGYCVSGQVLDALNQPLADVSVSLGDLQATTDAKGIFAFSRVAPGNYTLQATGAGLDLAPKILDVQANLWQVTFGGSPAAPTITTQPKNVTIQAKGKAVLSVIASGNELQYQWYQRASETLTRPIAGANGSSYTAGPLTRTSSYFVQVSNPYGTVESETVTVTVEDVAPAITAHPQDATIMNGQTARLSVTATGTSPKYQWYKGPSGVIDQPVSGATSASLTTAPLTETASYWVRVSNGKGQADSKAATITVITVTPPAITSQPQDVTVKLGESASLSIEATGTDLTCQWFAGASGDTTQPIAGATSFTLATTPMLQDGMFWVRVSNAAGAVDSAAIRVSVEMPEVIQNGSFESGATGWSGTPARIAVWPNQSAFEGSQCAWLCGSGRRATHILSQSLRIPAALPYATLTFQLHINTAEKSGAYDKLVVSILDAQGAPLKTLATFTNRDAANGYTLRSFDLSEFKDQDIKLQFKATEDSLYQTSFVVDDVKLGPAR